MGGREEEEGRKEQKEGRRNTVIRKGMKGRERSGEKNGRKNEGRGGRKAMPIGRVESRKEVRKVGRNLEGRKEGAEAGRGVSNREPEIVLPGLHGID